MAISVVSFSFSWCSTGGPGAQLSAECWLSLPHLGTYGSPNLLGVPRAPSAECGFPYHILSPTRLNSKSLGGPEGPLRQAVAFSTTSCLWLLWSPTHWLPVSTELYDSSNAHSIAHSILEWHVWSSSSGNNCHAVQRLLSSGASVYECIMGFYLVPFRQPNPPARFLLITGHWNVTSSRCITLEWHIWLGWRSIYNKIN